MRFIVSLIVLCFLCLSVSLAQDVSWPAAQKQAPEWYASAEALRIADNVLLYQRESGGWPKNIDMAKKVSDQAALSP